MISRSPALYLKTRYFFDNPPSLSDCGITEFQTMKYIDSIEGGSIIMAVEREIPDALDIPVEVNGMYQSLQLTNGRGYQSNLRDILMQTYGGKCAICEMDIPELLVVSHIIPHSKNENTARRLDNAIFLCKLHDSMFDQGFLTVLYESGKYFLKVSEQIKESTNPAVVKIYKELSTSMFHPPIEHPPSEESLRYHNSYVFLDNKKSEKL